jgi:uncharacterized RDD family membrane protein YckC
MNMPSYGRRFLATVLDCFIYLSMCIPVLLLTKKNIWVIAPWVALFDFIYFVYLAYRFDGTPGKKIWGLAIQSVDGSSIKLWAAAKRHYGVTLIGLMLALPFYALTLIFESGLMNAFLVGLANALPNLAFSADHSTPLFNDKRRALHDYLADTVVVVSD